MGMAAGQARLLSITSRMSDNELRAQIINNNKMRLATESSQASEAYVAALNEAQLMFSNYDAENNTTYQSLTFNALTSFNPYNNQYALINSSGNVLLSEKDAENYRASGGNLDAFLSKYGLEYTTTYFDQLGTSVKFEDYDNMSVTTEALLKLYSANAVKGDKVTLGKVGEIDLYDESRNFAVSYLGTANSVTMYDYLKYIQQYSDAKAKYLAFIKDAMMDAFSTGSNNLIKNAQFPGMTDITSIKSYLNVVMDEDPTATGATTAENMMTNIYNPLLGLINTMKASQYTNDNTTALDSLKKILENNSGGFVTDELSKDDYCYMTDGVNLYIALKDNGTPSKVQYLVGTDNNIYTQYSKDNIDSTSGVRSNPEVGEFDTSIFSDKQDSENEEDRKKPSAPLTVNSGTGLGWSEKPYVAAYVSDPTKRSDVSYSALLSGKTLYEIQEVNSEGQTVNPFGGSDGVISLYTKNDVQNMAIIARNVINSLESSIDSYWDSTASAWAANTTNSNLRTAYEAYVAVAKNLCNVIYGKDIPGKYDTLDDIYTLYKDYSDTEPFTDEFKKVFLNLVMDEVLDLYGEPKYTWIDVSDRYGEPSSYNTNGEAKAAWYENLFNRIKSGGYAVLQDGLASSSEWMQFAFESGIVTMEQVDSLKTWSPLIYTNCSDITSQTNEKMIAKAEAEYRNAMNKIENKDKRYDLELKNIDTEHNSLMTEYESIKTAIDKNIERTFKLYS